MHDSSMIVENSYYHALTYCETGVTAGYDSMIVGLRNFHGRREGGFRIAIFGAVALIYCGRYIFLRIFVHIDDRLVLNRK